MKNKIIIIILMVIMSLTGFGGFSYAKKNTDFFNDILKVTQGNTVEYGIRVSYEISENEEKYCLDLLNKLNLSNYNLSIRKDENIYSVEFNKNEEKGYIECSSYDNHNVVTINIIRIDNENKLAELKNSVEKAINKNEKEVEFFQYLKAKITENDKAKINNEIKNILKKEKVENIDSIELENGFSTVAYTKQYYAMRNNGKLMDLNYAVCSYSSGNYVIIGTPIILETY